MCDDRTPVDMPARKLRISDLAALTKEGGEWRYMTAKGFSVRLVWLQGHVISTSSDGTQVVISDEGSEAIIVNCDVVPGGTLWLRPDLYVMAVGLVEDSVCLPTVSAVKLSDLSSSPVHISSWPHEVAELKRLLAENPQLATL